jgi:hypothetical protein
MIVLGLFGSLMLAGFNAFTSVLNRVPERHQADIESISGGVGLAYVFLYLLFELVRDGAPLVHGLLPIGPEPTESLAILLAASVGGAYLLQAHLERTTHISGQHRALAAFFVAYNFLAGAGLAEEAHWGALNVAIYVAAVGVHMLCNERLLIHLYGRAHGRSWRATLAAAPVLGFAIAAEFKPPESALYVVLTVVAGATIINVVRRELPGALRIRPFPFLLGFVGYGALILAKWRF